MTCSHRSVKYTKSADGTNIAFWSLGSGTPFVHMPLTVINYSNTKLRAPEYLRWCDRLVEPTISRCPYEEQE